MTRVPDLQAPDLVAPADPAPHAASVDEVARLHGTDPVAGLDGSEAARRLERDGANVLPGVPGDPLALRILLQLHDPLIYVLLVAAAITLVLGEHVDTAVILGVVLVNALVGFVQESRALAALDSLRSLGHADARVVRGGRTVAVASEEVVVGDLVALEAGEKVPADLRVVGCVELRVDESTLTGESTTVGKSAAAVPGSTRVADRTDMLHAGTLVRSGTALALVVATADRTELGAIHRLVSGATVLATPLTRKLAHFSAVLTVVIVVLAGLAFAVGLLRGEDAPTMFTAAVALAVGAIPEGLPAAVTITLAIGVTRMVRRRAVVRHLPAVETLGSTTVICTDKTGTLTTNQMTVREVWTPDGTYAVTGTGYDPEGQLLREGLEAGVAGAPALYWCLAAGSACNDAGVAQEDGLWVITGDPTEAAMKVVALKTEVGAGTEAGLPRTGTIPFDSRRQYMATRHRRASGGPDVVLVKGAVERVAPMCGGRLRSDGTSTALDRTGLDAAVEAMAARGLRVLATAAVLDATDTELSPEGLGRSTMVLTGLQAMLDPPREAAASAIAACHAAGIQVRMITGDHASTAGAIAAELCLTDPDSDDRAGRVVTGADLAAMDDATYQESVAEARVFARVSPEEKVRLVEVLQARGHVVAMTGDGVNDAPALRRADIGIAMGIGGTEVAKDAADMVLVDDDFATIEAAVEEGRGVFDNLTKFIVWTLPTNMGEGLVILTAILLGTALPIQPTQILWINMTTAVVLGLTLAFEPREPGVMRRPPRAPDLPLLTRALVWRTVLVSGLLVAAAWWVFTSEQARGSSLAEARTAAVNVFVVVEIAYLVSCRSLTRPAWRLGLVSNPWVLGGILVQVVAQAAFTYLPAMQSVFGTAPIDLSTWLRILAVAAVVSVVVGADKLRAARAGELSSRVLRPEPGTASPSS